LTASILAIISQRDMKNRSRVAKPELRKEPAAGVDPQLDYRALAELRYQIRRFLTFSERRARAVRIKPQQHQLLLALKGLPEGQRPTISVLAERLQLKHHTLVGLVDRLVRAGLTVRRASRADGREILVQITKKGERLLRSLSLAHRAELQSAGPALATALEALLAPRKHAAKRRPKRHVEEERRRERVLRLDVLLPAALRTARRAALGKES
jgi:DNA-binding MarR family transcriptional regulator